MFQQSESQPLRSVPRCRFETAEALPSQRNVDRNAENGGASQKRLWDVLAANGGLATAGFSQS
jgi:hypothetical protein